MTRLVVGVIGHVDHGKTALVRALTGQDTDRLPEEKQRGISIALGFAHLQVAADTVIDLIDMPGHERFVRTMISGATGIDAALLVVSANEGIKPQTIEHIDIAGLMGLRRGIVVVTKTDLATAQQAQSVADEAMQLLAAAGIAAVTPVMTSAVRGTGIVDLHNALAALALEHVASADHGIAFFPVDRAFSIAGHGPVVTGTLRGAAVSVDETLELLPLRRLVRIRGIQVHGQFLTTAAPGQRVALNLRDVEVSELERGMSLAAPETLASSDWLTISIRGVASSPLLRNGMMLRALLGTSELDVRLRLLDRDTLGAGEQCFAQLHCSHPVTTPSRQHVVLRLPSPARTVAGGQLLETDARRLKRNCLPILRRLEDLQTLTPGEMIAAEIKREGVSGTSLKRLALLSALSQAYVAQLLAPLPAVITRTGLVVHKPDFDALQTRVMSLLTAHPAGLTHDQLLAAVPGTAIAVLSEALAHLQSRGVIRERSKRFGIPRPDEDLALARNETELATQIAGLLQRSGLTPPNPGEIVTSALSRRAVDRLLREGVVVRAVDRAKGRELLFHRQAIAQAQDRLAPLLQNAPGLLVTEIAAALGISRKFCMPLLDHLDAIHFTKRIDDRRVRETGTRAG